MKILWFIPTHGDSRYLGTSKGARAATFDYFKQIAIAADSLGYEGVLIPTGRSCEDSWILAASLIDVTRRLKFLVALRRVLEGGIYVSEMVGNSMIQKFASGGAYISANPIDRLSNRELQILHMIGRGLSTRQAAEALNLSVKTVESHRQRIKRKLNLSTGSQLVQYAVNWFSGREAGAA